MGQQGRKSYGNEIPPVFAQPLRWEFLFNLLEENFSFRSCVFFGGAHSDRAVI